MIDKVMSHIKNHFARSVESRVYEIVSDGIVGTFSETYIPNMYIWIQGSILNDGVYKISSVTTNKITVVETLIEENRSDTMDIYGLAPPKSFLEIVTEISNFKSNDGVSSESIDDYSVSYGTDGSWTNVFASKLSAYRRMYDDNKRLRAYNINTKRC